VKELGVSIPIASRLKFGFRLLQLEGERQPRQVKMMEKSEIREIVGVPCYPVIKVGEEYVA